MDIRTQSNESFSKAELYKNVGLQSGKKCPGCPVIDMLKRRVLSGQPL